MSFMLIKLFEITYFIRITGDSCLPKLFWIYLRMYADFLKNAMILETNFVYY